METLCPFEEAATGTTLEGLRGVLTQMKGRSTNLFRIFVPQEKSSDKVEVVHTTSKEVHLLLGTLDSFELRMFVGALNNICEETSQEQYLVRGEEKSILVTRVRGEKPHKFSLTINLVHG